jgi:hypothetical protein
MVKVIGWDRNECLNKVSDNFLARAIMFLLKV